MRASLAVACMFVAACGNGRGTVHGRVSSMTAVGGQEARAQGCNSRGSAAGAGFVAFADELGGLEALVSGEPIQWPVLLEAYPLGAEGEQTRFDLRWLDGVHLGEDRFQIDYASYVDFDPDAGGKQSFGPVEPTDGGWVSGHIARLTFPEVEGLGALTLEGVALEARLLLDEDGLAVRGGMLAGYLLRAAAAGHDLPYDATLGAGDLSPCDESDECDALSVCVSFDVEPLPPEKME